MHRHGPDIKLIFPITAQEFYSRAFGAETANRSATPSQDGKGLAAISESFFLINARTLDANLVANRFVNTQYAHRMWHTSDSQLFPQLILIG